MGNDPRELPPWIPTPGIDFREDSPPGRREEDWGLDQYPAIPLFDPATHRGSNRLSDLEEIFAPLVHEDEPTAAPIEFGSASPSIPVLGRSPDTLAWYRSFRYGTSWGIYIRERAALSLASFIASRTKRDPHSVEIFAWSKLYLHEYAHFLFDVAARSLEEAVGTGVYGPYRTEVCRQLPGWHLEAEALCNAFAYRKLPVSGCQRAVGNFMRSQPAGYRDFARYKSDVAFDSGLETVLGQMLRGLHGRGGVGLRPLFDDSDRSSVGPAMVPLYIVREPSAPPALYLITSLPGLEESKAFTKQLLTLPTAVREAWERDVLPLLRTDVRTAGHFKPLRGYKDLYSVRIYGNKYRAIIRREGNGLWTVESIDHRKDVYR